MGNSNSNSYLKDLVRADLARVASEGVRNVNDGRLVVMLLARDSSIELQPGDKELLNEVVRYFSEKGEIKGGEEAELEEQVIGGYKDLKEYGERKYHKEKEKLIRAIAGDVAKNLGISPKFAKESSLSEVIRRLKTQIPSIKGRQKFVKDAGKQAAFCRALADSINNRYGEIINMEASPATICKNVSAFIHTLIAGVHTEFMTVAGDVERTLNNMNILKEYLERVIKRLDEMIPAADDELKLNIGNVRFICEKLLNELGRQIAIMSSQLDVVITPTTRTLLSLMEEGKEFQGLVRELEDTVGVDEFSRGIGALLNGITNMAYIVEQVEGALKTLGMSVKEYKDIKGIGDIRAEVMKLAKKRALEPEELMKIMAASEILKQTDYAHDNIMQALEKRARKIKGGLDIEDVEPVPKPRYTPKTALSRRIKKQKKFRDILFVDFNKSIKDQYTKIIVTLNKIIPKIGKEIEINDKLDTFIKRFMEWKNPEKENIHLALSGFRKDATSRYEKNEYMAALQVLADSVKPLEKEKHGQLFTELHRHLEGLMKLIDDFNDTFLKAITQIPIDRKGEEEKKKGGAVDATDYVKEMVRKRPEKEFEYFTSLKKIQDDLYYYYRTANITKNLKIAAEQFGEYTKDYENTLGDEAAHLIYLIEKEYKDDMDNLLEEKKRIEEKDTLGMMLAEIKDEEKREGYRNAYSTLRTFQKNASVELLKGAQALDLYLQAFAEAIASNPEDVSNLAQILESIDIIARWFVDRSGDNLALVYEAFPSEEGKESEFSKNKEGKLPLEFGEEKGGHYYKYLVDNNKKPGHPFYGFVPKNENQVKALMKQIRKAVSGMRALDNIFSSFRDIGSKFGKLNIESKTFIPPAQMAKIMIDYIVASSVAVGKDPKHGERTTYPDIRETFGRRKVGGATIDTYYEEKFGQIEQSPRLGEKLSVTMRSIEYNSKLQEKYRNWQVYEHKAWDASKLEYTIAKDFYKEEDTANIEEKIGVQISELEGKIPPIVKDIGTLESEFTRASEEFDALEKREKEVTGEEREDIRKRKEETRKLREETKKGLGQAKIDKKILEKEIKDLEDVRGKPEEIKKALDKLTEEKKAEEIKKMQKEYREKKYIGQGECPITGGGLLITKYKNDFEITDQIFEMMLKAIVAKVLTAVGTFSLLNRPTFDPEQLSISPLRMILGGVEIPPAIDDATELYLRLPLLAEWYREKFNFAMRGEREKAGWQISMIPSFDSVWGDFVNLVFVRAEYVKDGTYTDITLKQLIVAINNIYKHYKSKHPGYETRDIIDSFINEINRRYGIIKRSEIIAYRKAERVPYESTDAYPDIEAERVDFDILDEEDAPYRRGPAPSDKFRAPLPIIGARKRDDTIKLWADALAFREDIEKEFEEFVGKIPPKYEKRRFLFNPYSFVENIKQTKDKLKQTTNPQERYEIISKLIQGVNKYTNITWEKLLSFHELVVTPLCLLNGIHKLLYSFVNFINGGNLELWSKAVAEDRSMEDIIKERWENIGTRIEDLKDQLRVYTEGIEAPPETKERKGINRQKYMVDLINWLFTISCDLNDLAEVKFSIAGHPVVDLSKLQDLCVTTYNQIKTAANKFRNVLPAEIVGKFVTKDKGGLVWIEENMIEKIFNNRDGAGLAEVNESLAQTWKNLTKEWAPEDFDSFDEAISKLLYWWYDEDFPGFGITVARTPETEMSNK
jgi:hypothetical protein